MQISHRSTFPMQQRSRSNWLPERQRIVFKIAALCGNVSMASLLRICKELCIPVKNVRRRSRLRSASTLPTVAYRQQLASEVVHSMFCALRDNSLSLYTDHENWKTGSYHTVLRELHRLPVRQRIDFKLAVLAHKALHGQLPQYTWLKIVSS